MKNKLLVLAMVAMAGSANAAIVSYTASIAPSTTNWNQTLNLGIFDTSLGVLDSVTFRYYAGVSSTFMVESLQATPSFVQLINSGTVTFGGIIANPLGMHIGSSTGRQVSAFDGTIDFGGTSGFVISGVRGSGAGTLNLANGFDAFEALGGGVFGINVVAVGSSFVSGAPNLMSEIGTSANAGVTVFYYYTVPSNNNVPEPESLALLGLGLVGLVASRRRKTA